MIEVELTDLKKVGKQIADAVKERAQIDVNVKGGTLSLNETKNRPQLNIKDVKMQMKHVLHHLGFSEEYRVLAEHHKIRIQKIERDPQPGSKEPLHLQRSRSHTSSPLIITQR